MLTANAEICSPNIVLTVGLVGLSKVQHEYTLPQPKALIEGDRVQLLSNNSRGTAMAGKLSEVYNAISMPIPHSHMSSLPDWHLRHQVQTLKYKLSTHLDLFFEKFISILSSLDYLHVGSLQSWPFSNSSNSLTIALHSGPKLSIQKLKLRQLTAS